MVVRPDAGWLGDVLDRLHRSPELLALSLRQPTVLQ